MEVFVAQPPLSVSHPFTDGFTKTDSALLTKEHDAPHGVHGRNSVTTPENMRKRDADAGDLRHHIAPTKEPNWREAKTLVAGDNDANFRSRHDFRARHSGTGDTDRRAGGDDKGTSRLMNSDGRRHRHHLRHQLRRHLDIHPTSRHSAHDHEGQNESRLPKVMLG